MNFTGIIICVFVVFLSFGCAPSTKQILASSESQVKLRSIQTRVFDTTDKLKTMRTVIATLQDLGFVIDKADDVLGSISATKWKGYALRMTVNVSLKGDSQTRVRANAQYNNIAVEDPEPYQQFFQSLEKSMFLTAHLEE